MHSKLSTVKLGLVLSMLTILLGFALGAVMGGAESQIKAYWQAAANQVLPTVYGNDPQKVAAMVSRSWVFMIRAHIHAAALGATSAVMICIVTCLNVAENYKKITALLLGLGSLGYSFSWLFTAFAIPTIGNVAAAKASIHFLAAGSIGMLLLGTIAVIGLCGKELYILPKS